MKKYFYYRKRTNQLIMTSDNELNVDPIKLGVIVKDVDEEFLKDIKRHKRTFIEKGEFKKVPWSKEELETLQEKGERINGLKDKVKNSQNFNELKVQVGELIDNLL